MTRSHPNADGGETDYDGIQKGKARLAPWYPAREKGEAYRAKLQSRLMLMRLGAGVKDAAISAALELVEHLMLLLSKLIYDATLDDWREHTSKGFKAYGRVCKGPR